MYRKGVVITIIFLFIGMSILPSTGSILLEKSTASTLDGNTLYVGGSGPGNYSRIQDAIDNASDGDTVFVYDDSSPYYENLDVNKIISLIGENRGTTVIDGSWIGDVVTVSADWVTISGFTIRNGELGIHIDSDYNTITGNNISNNGIIGIFIGNSHNNTITGNNSISNNGYGIIIGNSHNNTITDNNISNNWRGIYLDDSSNNTITGNNIISNGFYGGIYLDDSSNNTITGNNISNNEYGIGIGNSHNNTITGNNSISNNGWGIYLDESSNNTITGNSIISNNLDGILLYSSSNNNTIYHNNFINNSQNAHDECDNTWDDGEYGNYWSDYEERYPDAKKKWWKGIWDTPYEIPGGDSKDMCPLIKQWPDPYPYNNNQVQSKNNVVKKTINTITSQTSNQQQSTQHKPVIPKISRATPKSVPDTKTSARTNSILEL